MTATTQSIAAASVASGVVDVTPAKPTGTVSGSLLVAFCWTSTTNATWSATGFTSAGNNVGTGSSAVLWRLADGTEGSTITFTRAASTTGTAGVILVRISGHHATSPIDVASFGVASGTTTVAIDSQAPSGTDNLLLQMVSRVNTAANSWTPPGTATERVDTTADSISYAVGDEIVAAGGTGTRSWTYTALGQSRAAMVTINPAAAAVTGTASLAEAATITSSATVGKLAGAAVAAVTALASAGLVATASSGTLDVTATVSADGAVTSNYVAGADLPSTATMSADGAVTVNHSSGADLATTATLDTTATSAIGGAAQLALTATPITTGRTRRSSVTTVVTVRDASRTATIAESGRTHGIDERPRTVTIREASQ